MGEGMTYDSRSFSRQTAKGPSSCPVAAETRSDRIFQEEVEQADLDGAYYLAVLYLIPALLVVLLIGGVGVLIIKLIKMTGLTSEDQ